MSCVSFLSPQQRVLLRAAPAGPAVSSFQSPEVTDGKVRRLRQMVLSPYPKIRESAALAHATPEEVLDALARDPDPGVRCSVARNEHTPPATLRVLSRDVVAGVRGWVAANAAVPVDALERLADDPDATVRSVTVWASSWPSSPAQDRAT